jgi:hypothetical protein
MDSKTYNQKIIFINTERLKILNGEKSPYTLDGLALLESRIKAYNVVVGKKET